MPKSITKWECNDGFIFDTEAQALEHEQNNEIVESLRYIKIIGTGMTGSFPLSKTDMKLIVETLQRDWTFQRKPVAAPKPVTPPAHERTPKGLTPKDEPIPDPTCRDVRYDPSTEHKG